MDWTGIVIAAITGLLAGGGVAGIIRARANSTKTLGDAWSKYAHTLEQEMIQLKKDVAVIPALRASIETMGEKISVLQAENISLQAQHEVQQTWNEDMKVWASDLSKQVVELGGTPAPFKRKKKS